MKNILCYGIVAVLSAVCALEACKISNLKTDMEHERADLIGMIDTADENCDALKEGLEKCRDVLSANGLSMPYEAEEILSILSE